MDELRLAQALLAAGLSDLSLADAAFRRLDERLQGREEPEAKAMRAMAMIGWAGLVTDSGDRNARRFTAPPSPPSTTSSPR